MGSSRDLPYLSDTIDELAGPYLAEFGFFRIDVTSNRVTYAGDRVLVSFAYHVEDLPTPSLAVDVGLLADDGSRHLVGLWRALPDEDAARGYPGWRFHDEASLRQVLQRVVTEVLAVHGPRLWNNPVVLERLLAAQAEEVETRYLEDRREADLRRARRAYEDGHFQEAVDSYVLLGSDTLAAYDRRLLYLSRKQVGGADAPFNA